MDLIELFEENGVQVWRRGKNVSYGWIGIQCVFCDDQSNHLGINLRNYDCRCWKCGKHKFSDVLRETLDISKSEAIQLAKEIDPSEISEGDDDRVQYDSSMSIKLPPESVRRFPNQHYRYLKERGFPVLKTIREYRLRAVEHIGPYKFRIIIPIIYQGKIVSFTSRDITNQAQAKYKAAPASLYPNPKHFIYNADSVSEGAQSAVLVEGPTDVWRLGKGSISLMGVKAHGKQLVHLARKQIKTLHVLFDNDATGYRASVHLAKALRSFVREVNIVSLTEAADPGVLTREQGEIVMRRLGVIR